jgi:hypothetical protein
MKAVFKKFTFTKKDALESVCHNRAHCWGATGIKRELGLSDHNYIRVYEDQIAYTRDDLRYFWATPLEAVKHFIAFDDNAKSAETFTATFSLIKIIPKAKPASRARKDKINLNAAGYREEQRAKGTPKAPRDRFKNQRRTLTAT